MLHRTGYSVYDQGNSKYIQVETVLVFYREKFIISGKHMLFEDTALIGNMSYTDNGLSMSGLERLTQSERLQLVAHIKNYVAPDQASCAPTFGFGLQIKDNVVYCEIIVTDHIYHVWFDGKKVGKLTQNERFNWLQMQSELLPAGTLREISDRIEKHYVNF
ncbi:hypothetical protein HH214_06180 [Mucilaginibacter robiniae]|uniref:Uncharacterized protein n=1 Tax=Mucilaginibacter robiniae TaxID=2728022 RepID=A0A7L5DWM3_9SPHI|nr:hypothetical protein [Mucilaginibacter robiniae]QJD95490.1 hypothetical protein HH214_06180 [Mucilaginibacter robiniae]